MRNLVWLFPAHRELHAGYTEMKTTLEILTDRCLRTEEDNKKLVSALEKLQAYVANNPSHMEGIVDLFQRYQEKVLQDLPYDNNRIPDSAWLTPGEVEPGLTSGNAGPVHA